MCSPLGHVGKKLAGGPEGAPPPILGGISGFAERHCTGTQQQAGPPLVSSRDLWHFIALPGFQDGRPGQLPVSTCDLISLCFVKTHCEGGRG